jgi:hypothetical protein
MENPVLEQQKHRGTRYCLGHVTAHAPMGWKHSLTDTCPPAIIKIAMVALIIELPFIHLAIYEFYLDGKAALTSEVHDPLA